MTLLSDADDVSRKKPNGLYALIAIVVIASAAYFFLFRTSTESEMSRTADAPSATPPASVPVPPAPSESPPPPSEPEIAEAPRPTEEPVSETEPEPATAPPLVVLQVMADIDGADVFIDRSYVGTTPFESTTLGPGRYRVNVSASGYETYEEDIEIGGEQASVVVTFREVYLDERVEVIHKHRFGNCAGELVASTSGIRYQTSDDDAFEITFEAMEEFVVAYLEHNLRIKVREGRTYNFTDELENAETLLLFHRAVENARGRLALGDRPVLP